MPDNSILLLIGLEVAVVLICLIGLVLWRARSLSKTGSALEAKVIELRQALKGARNELKVVRAEATPAPAQADYGEIIDVQIGATRNHHLGLNPERDIVLDMAMDAPAERRAVSLRHAFLIAEKEAWLASDNGRDVDWNVLEAKLGQIIQFYEQPATPSHAETFPDADGLEALDLEGDIAEVIVPADQSEISALQELVESQKRQIANLERFKKLFFDADDKWRKAGKQAEQYRQEILAHSRTLNAGDEFNALMDNYNRVYMEFGSALAEEGESPPPALEVGIEQPSVGKIIIANQEEMQRLRNMAVDQHKMILRLRQELESAHTLEEKDYVIGELHKQLERHERFLKESDICTKQLENELERVLEENNVLKKKVIEVKQSAGADQIANTDVEKMAAIIEDFTQQSGEMLSALEVLENECNELRQQLKRAEAVPGDPTAVDGLKEQLAAAQQELLNLQTQHIELEERYLELKTASL